jgi:catechol 2,3-dioxygenase-like lactoylglutathione lyase family enzyme
MIKPTGLTRGHCECRSLEQTVPMLTDLLAFEVLERRPDEAVLQHPNTAWQLVVHEAADSNDKPHQTHYGVRVATPGELDAAFEYISARKERYGIKRVSKPHENHFARSVYFRDEGGNDWEIEYYDVVLAAGGRENASQPWAKLLPEERFPGRGYLPQALSHGTREAKDKDATVRFLTDVLGLQLAGGGRMSAYIKHHATPWYIVVIPQRGSAEHRLSPLNRFTLEVASPEEVEAAHQELASHGEDLGLTSLEAPREANGELSFILGDLDRNWWEISAKVA